MIYLTEKQLKTLISYNQGNFPSLESIKEDSEDFSTYFRFSSNQNNFTKLEEKFAYGDYVNCDSVDIANYRYFLDSAFCKESIEISSYLGKTFWKNSDIYGNKSLLFLPYEMQPKIIQETLKSLEDNHPVCNDEYLSKVEYEMIQDTWHTFYYREIYTGLLCAIDEENEKEFYEYVDSLSSDFLWEITHAAMEKNNTYVQSIRNEMRIEKFSEILEIVFDLLCEEYEKINPVKTL